MRGDCKGWENGIFILGDSDEVLDHTIAEKVIGKADKYVVRGGHSLNRETSLPIFNMNDG